MNIKGFFVDALNSALDLGIAKPEDVLRHVTPDVLAQYLPRPLWARLLTACLGAPRVDAQLVVETIGLPNLCEHVPGSIMWACLSEVAARSLGKPVRAATEPILLTSPKEAKPVLAPPPDKQPVAAKPLSPLRPTPPSGIKPIPAPVDAAIADLSGELDPDTVTPHRARTPTGQRFRQSATGIGRMTAAQQARRPQAVAPAPVAAKPHAMRRGATEIPDVETDTELGLHAREIAVDDSQLVDWSESTQSNDDDFGDLGRKR